MQLIAYRESHRAHVLRIQLDRQGWGKTGTAGSGRGLTGTLRSSKSSHSEPSVRHLKTSSAAHSCGGTHVLGPSFSEDVVHRLSARPACLWWEGYDDLWGLATSVSCERAHDESGDSKRAAASEQGDNRDKWHIDVRDNVQMASRLPFADITRRVAATLPTVPSTPVLRTRLAHLSRSL